MVLCDMNFNLLLWISLYLIHFSVMVVLYQHQHLTNCSMKRKESTTLIKVLLVFTTVMFTELLSNEFRFLFSKFIINITLLVTFVQFSFLIHYMAKYQPIVDKI